VAPYPGLHLLGAWHRRPDGQTVWAGVSVDLFGVELMGAGRAASPSAPRAADRMAWALTLRTQDRGALPINLRRHVDVQVAGTLRAGKQAPWQAEEAVALLPARLARLAEDDGVASVALYIDDVDVGLATVTELRNAIGRLRAQGKRVTAHLQVASTKAYLIAAAAEHITLDPLGTLDVRGMALKSHFYGDALKALGVRMEVVGVGRYKTAPDRYSRAEPRPEELEVGEGLVQQAYAYVLQVLDEDRGLSPEAAHQALASGPLGGAEAVRLHLVDDISPRVGAGTVLGPKGDGPEGEPLFGPGPRIALVAVQGMLSQDGQGSPLLGPATSADSVVRALGRAARDPDVAGVVLRIDSPGGDVLAAEEVYRAVHDFAARKPVAVSMGDVAASGGYWAAMGAPMIFAEPQTLTGSIGIYSMRADLSGLLERLAVHTHETKAGERAGAGAWERPMEADERAHEQAHLNSLYEMFVHKVAASRKLTQKRAAELAEGRVYTGADALALGLVDAMGGFMDAYQWVAQQAGVAQDPALGWQVPHRRPSLPALWGPWGMVLGDTSASENPWQLGATHARFLGSLAARPQALMPGWIMGTASLL
jgi:protease-4